MALWLPDDKVLAENPDELKLALERYRRVLDGSGYAFWEWGLHNGSYRCGGAFWKKLGYESVEEAVTCVENVQDYVHPDDFKVLYDVVLNHLRYDTPVDVVYRIKAKDGNYWWTQACASSTRDENGRVTYLSGVNFDLSHLKDTEKALRLSEARHERILAGSNDGIWEWSAEEGNSDGRFHTSHSCWQPLGYTEEEVDALPEDERLAIWRSHIHPDDLKKMRHALKRHFVSKTPFDMEYRMFGHGGKMFWVRSRGRAIFNGQGRAILMSGINIDVTELKKAQERVRKAKEDAEKANQAKSNFLSSMSHELRTPLNAIMGFSQLSLNNLELDEEHREQARQIYQAGGHLLQLINDVLDLAQIESGRVPLLFEPVSPSALVQECFDLVAAMANRRNISLHCNFSSSKNILITADVKRLKQCLLNLINNAVKYNKDNGEVNISFVNNGLNVDILVEDTGPGVALDRQAELFQPFNRLGYENSFVDGTGIGLVITKELIESMRGSLSYCDTTSPGACFKISLPVENVFVEKELSDNKVLGEDLAAGIFVTQSSHIIYIEDNVPSQKVLSSLLDAYTELTVDCYADPYQGLYAVRSQLPDIIILDINLPELTGFDLLEILKADELTRHIPIVALSASAMPADIEKGRLGGFDEYLTKPVKLQEILGVLNRLLSQAAA